MLSKLKAEHPSNSYKDLQEALLWRTQAKNACSLRNGYAPEVLVLGRHTRIPVAISIDEMLPAHMLADSETAQGVQFRRQLALRERARRPFHHADNDAALRRSILRRNRPGISAYQPGEWVMAWRPGKGSQPARGRDQLRSWCKKTLKLYGPQGPVSCSVMHLNMCGR